MSIPARVSDYLESQQIPYDLVAHDSSNSSISSAVLAQIPLHKIAKAVILEDHESHHLMAILPANHKISLSKLNEELHRSFQLVTESQLYQMFGDCEEGAVPPIGEAYHLDMCWDEVLNSVPDVYLEAGDHNTLVHLSHDNFRRLMKESKHLFFSSTAGQGYQ